jgi:hypothetical protein
VQLLGAPVQIAYAVNDVEEAAHHWAEAFGAGPFFLSRHIPVTDVVHRGKPSVFDHTSAYGQWGSIMVELVQDHGTSGSAVRDLYAPGETGLHHMAYLVDDLDQATAALGDAGYELAQTARAGDTRFNFVDAVDDMGHFLELYEPLPGLMAFYEHVASKAQGWDGSRPVRER